MSSLPSRRASEPSNHPPSVFQSLLDEIECGTADFEQVSRALTRTAPASRSGSLLVNRRPAGLVKPRSVWVPSSRTAREARDKLRAHDEARYLRNRKSDSADNVGGRKERTTAERDKHATDEAQVSNATLEAPDAKSSAMHISFNAVDFSGAAASPATSGASTSESAEPAIARPHSPPQSPGVTFKRAHLAAGLDYDFPEQDESSPDSQRDKRPSISRRDTLTVITSAPAEAIQKPPAPATTEPIRRANRISDSFLASTASNRYALPKVTPTPSTPPQARTLSDSTPRRSPMPTPAWMRPFQLVTTDRAIYMHQHGDV